jgi:uncharacterized membrane protein
MASSAAALAFSSAFIAIVVTWFYVLLWSVLLLASRLFDPLIAGSRADVVLARCNFCRSSCIIVFCRGFRIIDFRRFSWYAMHVTLLLCRR